MTDSISSELRVAQKSFANLDIAPHHQALLERSGISPEVATRRGYRTARTKDDLGQLGFGRAQARPMALVLPVWNVHGEVKFHQIRPDRPRIVGQKEAKYETPAGVKMTIDVPPAVRPNLGDPTKDLFITEGIRKADSAASRDLCCIDLLGVWNWRGTNVAGGKTALPDWEAIALNDRRVYLVFDSDVMTKGAVRDALVRLRAFLGSRGAHVHVVYLRSGANGEKVGLDDFLAAGHTIQDLYDLAEDDLRPLQGDAGDARDHEPQSSSSTVLVSLCDEQAKQLFHTPDGRAFATFNSGEHDETWPIDSKEFSNWLARLHYQEANKVPSGRALADALRLLEGRARFDGPEQEVFVRLAEHDGSIFLDLCNSSWTAVHITAGGWNVVSDLPVRFTRKAGMLTLPDPQRAGKLDDLRRLLNVRGDPDFLLIVAWLLGALRPRGPYPVLVLAGEQGSAKSTASRLLRRIVDPNIADLRGDVREARDLMIAARNSWVIALDNVSFLHTWLSDCLCRLATGGGFTTRALYTNDDETIFNAMRPVVMNGISDFVTRGDLADRAIFVTLEPIPAYRRDTEERLWAAFDALHPGLLGALLTRVSEALANIDNVRLPALPRMADFAEWAYAALGQDGQAFLSAYVTNREDANIELLESDPIVAPLRAVAERTWKTGVPWIGTATALLAEITNEAGEAFVRSQDWPCNAKRLSERLRRLAPALRATGLDFHAGRRGHGGARQIELRPIEGGTSGDGAAPASPSSPADSERDCEGNAGPLLQDDPASLETDCFWPACIPVPAFSVAEDDDRPAADDYEVID